MCCVWFKLRPQVNLLYYLTSHTEQRQGTCTQAYYSSLPPLGCTQLYYYNCSRHTEAMKNTCGTFHWKLYYGCILPYNNHFYGRICRNMVLYEGTQSTYGPIVWKHWDSEYRRTVPQYQCTCLKDRKICFRILFFLHLQLIVF